MKASRYVLAALSGIGAATSDCCDQLKDILPTRISYPGSTSYNSTETSYFSIQESELRPACVLRPTTTQDVAKAVSVIASIPECRFAVKGGGHSPAAGFANIQDGVTIDMASLSSIEVNYDQSIANISAGAISVDVYKYLEPLGLAVTAGRNGHVGVGGFLLGGGISHFTTRVGWACDNVVNYEVILSSGEAVQANRWSYPDLYHALCGGGNNFGIVTRFDLRTFPQGNISVTRIKTDISDHKQLFGAFTDIVNASPFDADASLVTSLLFNSSTRQWTMSSSAVYTKPVLSPGIFKNVSSLPNIPSETTITSLANFAHEAPTPPRNWLFSTATFKANSSFMAELFEILNSTLYDFHPSGGVVWSIALEPLAGEMLNTGMTLGMDHTHEGYIILLSPFWPNSSSRGLVGQVAEDVLSRIEVAARKRCLLQRFQYFNYAAASQKPLESYGLDHAEFLRQVSRNYDPHGVMQRQLEGGHKVFKTKDLA